MFFYGTHPLIRLKVKECISNKTKFNHKIKNHEKFKTNYCISSI